MIERLRSLRDALDAAIEALAPLDAVLVAWAADTVQTRAQGTTATRPNGAAQSEPASPLGGAFSICAECGAAFSPRKGGGPPQRYCSPACRRRSHAKTRAARQAANGKPEPAVAADVAQLPDVVERPLVFREREDPATRAALQLPAI